MANLSLVLESDALDLTEYQKDGYVLQVRYKVTGKTKGKSFIGMKCGEGCGAEIEVTDPLNSKDGQGWIIGELELGCFKDKGVDLSKVTHPFVLTSDKGMEVSITNVKLFSRVAPVGCAFW